MSPARRNALILGRRRNAYIVGLPLDESEDLLKQRWAHAGKPELAWYQKWKAGDLVMWDNRYAMHRTQIKGDRPFFDPATLAS
jgi:taurine dioxygenase